MTTTKGHNARSNGIVEVFWRYWNRCMRMLSDDQYRHWPRYASRIVFAYRTAAHQSIGMISPYEIQYGAPARDTFSGILTVSSDQLQQLPNDDGDMENARLFALAVKTSTMAFIQLAKNHDQYVKTETADMLFSSLLFSSLLVSSHFFSSFFFSSFFFSSLLFSFYN